MTTIPIDAGDVNPPSEVDAETRPSRLATAVAIAVLCRDNGLNYPSDVSFSAEYPQLLDVRLDDPADVAPWALVFGVEVQPVRGSGNWTHHTAEGRWQGYRLTVVCLVERAEPAPPVDAGTSALIDSLAADTAVSE